MKIAALLIAASAMTMSIVAAPASAQSTTFTITYSGLPFGNAAVGTGSFTISNAALASINANPRTNPAYTALSALTLTISGAASGNGTFGLADFNFFYFDTPSALDFSRELIGQTLSNGFTYGDRAHGGSTGDFNLFGTGGSRPYGYNYFGLRTNNLAGDQLAVTSITAAAVTGAVPEPATWAMMIVGLGAVGYAMRRRQQVAVRVSYAA